MWISKKAFENMQQFLTESRATAKELSLAFNQVKKAMADKDATISALRKQLETYESAWIKTRCPHCLTDINFHTMSRKIKE